MQMAFGEIILISVGLSLDVFVAVAYLGAGFSKINKKNLAGLCILFGGIQLLGLIIGNLLTLLPVLPGKHLQNVTRGWEGITALIFAGLGIYMMSKGVKHENVLERRNDEIDWESTALLAILTSIDATLAGIGLGFLGTEMILQSCTLFPITVLQVILGVYVGYRLGLRHNRHAYWIGGALLLLSSIDVVIHYQIIV